MKSYSLGLDYGTNSVRSLIVDLENGDELGSVVFPYPSGELGILTDPSNPNVARQNPQDYIDGLIQTTKGAIDQARNSDSQFDPERIVGIGVDTTGSTVIPVDASGTPLGLLPEYRDNLAAMVWLWKDHSGHEEAALITEKAKELRPNYLAKCGGTYSSEWWWSKILRCKNDSPEVFSASHSWVEHCDFIPALITGNAQPHLIKRGICSAGHKAMFCEDWGGLPDKEFLSSLDPALADLRERLYASAVPASEKAGELTAEWAKRLGLSEGTPVAVGAFDAHMGAVGAGVKEGTLVKILGTSTCDITVSPNSKALTSIPGLCGIVDGSVLPGCYGIEAGQSAVGDIFLWFVHHLVPDSYGNSADEKFVNMERELAKLKPGETGLLALDWNNGNRTILVDVRLSGLILGQTLHTEAHEIYRALIEATAFGALIIIEQMEEYGLSITEVINTGGLAVKNETLMQIYADIIGRPLSVAASDQTCALGAAVFGAVAAGAGSIAQLQSKVCRVRDRIFEPNPENQQIYADLYRLYSDLYHAFGTSSWSGKLDHVMKQVIDIRDRQRKATV
ncbi:MAG: ribulokinase [Verrucomicrobiota bacterium]